MRPSPKPTPSIHFRRLSPSWSRIVSRTLTSIRLIYSATIGTFNRYYSPWLKTSWDKRCDIKPTFGRRLKRAVKLVDGLRRGMGEGGWQQVVKLFLQLVTHRWFNCDFKTSPVMALMRYNIVSSWGQSDVFGPCVKPVYPTSNTLLMSRTPLLKPTAQNT